ncbi:hypothetical protein AiwAL_10010 [Acidiphilium sp. AL]|uniref:N-acyl amino acid synthase FeeM domain-containing protein n=1 Tax=Acidiphilium sp. AL TaxID=2871704 RepID=UPI0021CB6EDE|nr:hypothetical protein [Acidiphilium sp. AL]MCU4160441.1 hypothetical protein [Acidiphilium sp. AL]
MDGSIVGSTPTWTLAPSANLVTRSDKLMARLAATPEIMRQAWSLRYESYYCHGFLEENQERLFPDEYDSLETSKTIVIYKYGEPIASVRVCLHDPVAASKGIYTMPIMATFPDVIPELIERYSRNKLEQRAVEVLRLVSHPSVEKNVEVIFALFRMAKYLTKYFESGILFCGVRQNHAGIYRRIGFDKKAEPRHYYPKLKFQTALMMGIECEYEIVQQKIPFLRNVFRYDETYSNLLAGKLVPVFADVESYDSSRETINRSEILYQNAA